MLFDIVDTMNTIDEWLDDLLYCTAMQSNNINGSWEYDACHERLNI